MNLKPANILEATFILVLIYLVLGHAAEFSKVISAAGGAYGSGVKSLQGR